MPKATSAEPSAPLDMAQNPTSGRWAELLTPRYLVTTVMLCIGVALYAFNGFLVTTALPTAVAELGGEALLSWSLTLFLAASIVAGASAALLKARFGARLSLIGAALVFLAGTLLAASATSMETILVGRVLQGLGEGVVAAICYALIPEMFPSRLVPKVFGAEASVWALAAFGGPVLAGYLTETISWRAAFLINIPIIAVFMLLAITIVPRTISTGGGLALPGLRLALLCCGFVAVLFAGLAPSVLISAALVAFCAVMLVVFIRLDRRAKSRILPAGAFSLRSTLGLGLWVILLMPLAQSTSGVYLVYSLQHLWGFGPTHAGALGALMAIFWSLSAIAIANLKSQALQRRAIWLGPLLQVLGMACLFSAIASGILAVLVLGQVLIGCAFGLTWGTLSQLLMDVTPANERDKTSALLPTLQSAGYALGAGLAGLAANGAGLAAGLPVDGLRVALAVAFFIAVLWSAPGFLAARRAVALVHSAAIDRTRAE
ncbi:MFS transporter [Rhizobium sp. CG5]|nr:MFS transporter [Rhizobium sp. CG5]